MSFATFEAETTIYAKQEDGRFSKAGTFLTLFSDLVLNAPTLITIPDPALHKRLHKVIQQAFTPQALASQEPIQKLHIERAMPDFDDIAVNGTEIDLADKLETMFWEIIGDLAFGEPLMAGKRREWQCDTTDSLHLADFVRSNIRVLEKIRQRIDAYSGSLELHAGHAWCSPCA